MDNKESGYIKKVVTMYIKTSVGDHWKNNDDCKFIELKGQEGYVVEEKEKE